MILHRTTEDAKSIGHYLYAEKGGGKKRNEGSSVEKSREGSQKTVRVERRSITRWSMTVKERKE